jgi:diguanylate cyclase (GGDEF)-like protein
MFSIVTAELVPAMASVVWAQDDMLRAALDVAVDGHALWAPIVDEDGKLVDLVCVYMNRAAELTMGRGVGDVVGRRMLGEEGSSKLGPRLLSVAMTGVPLRRRLRLKTKSGRQIWIDLVAMPLRGGLSVTGRNVSSEVRLSAELEGAMSELARLAATDPLTGLANRRTWEKALTEHLDAAADSGQPLVVAILDLDQFKAYNDRNGHLAGDRHLVEVARLWAKNLPPHATLARLGGEEFAIALPGTDPVTARELLGRLCALVPGGETSSAGITAWDGSETEASLLGRADAALYAAKHAGRNRIEAVLPLG